MKRHIAAAALITAITATGCSSSQPEGASPSSSKPAVALPPQSDVHHPGDPKAPASTCAAARKAFLTGTPSDITGALQALVADQSAPVKARERAQEYLDVTDPKRRAYLKKSIRITCND